MILIWMILAVSIYRCSTWTKNSASVRNQIEKQVDEKEQEIQEVPEMNEEIRVLIRNSDYEEMYHQELILSSDAGLVCKVGQQYYECTSQQKMLLTAKQLLDKEATIWTKHDGQISLENIDRSEKVQYRGSMECYGTNEGIILVNELPVEEYLYGVVPSEMPSSYPLEALKAQAICARTYAYYHKQSYAYPEWRVHVDDSTTYQVYKNISETEETKTAIDATKGQVLTCNGELIESFYYATSSGYSSGYEVWGTEERKNYLQVKELALQDKIVATMTQESDAFSTNEGSYRKYIDQGKETDVEYKESWYRWNYDMNVNKDAFLQKVYDMEQLQPEHITITAKEQNIKQTFLEEKGIQKIQIVQRLESGLAQEVKIETQHYEVLVRTQHIIRQLLAQSGESVIRQDGTEYKMGDLLPSAYFYLDCIYGDTYVERIEIRGGGFGHGVGMSQNGAKCLAQNGINAEEILKFYYHDVQIENRNV